VQHRDIGESPVASQKLSNTGPRGRYGTALRRGTACQSPRTSGTDGPSWLAFLAQAKDSLWSVDLFRCESILLRSHWVMVVIDVFTRRWRATRGNAIVVGCFRPRCMRECEFAPHSEGKGPDFARQFVPALTSQTTSTWRRAFAAIPSSHQLPQLFVATAPYGGQ
jgi:hypothetical protein